jgi:hypothetical protein
MPFSPVWIAGTGNNDNWYNHIDMWNIRPPDFLPAFRWLRELSRIEDQLKTPGLTLSHQRTLRARHRDLRRSLTGFWEHVGRIFRIPGGPYGTKVEAMANLQHLDFQREQSIMREHYRQYMNIFHRVMWQMLQNQAPQWSPVIP